MVGINIIWYNEEGTETGRTYMNGDTNYFNVPSNHPVKGQMFLTTEPVKWNLTIKEDDNASTPEPQKTNPNPITHE